MKHLHLMIVAGGLLAGAAFFLPYALARPVAGVFSAGISFKDMTNDSLSVLGLLTMDRGHMFLGYMATLLEPAGALLLLLGGLVAPKLKRTGALCGCCGALFVLMLMVWLPTYSIGYYQAVYPFLFLDLGHYLRELGTGYWLAILGGVLGLVGALAVWLEQPRRAMPMDQPPGRPAHRIRPGALLSLCGGLVVLSGIFVVPFFSSARVNVFADPLFPSVREESLVGTLSQSYGLLFFWAVLLALLLLVASSLIALMGGKAAYLGSLSGALVGLTFLLLILSPVSLGGGISAIEIGTGSWLLLIGCVLGLTGTVLGLLERPASPRPAEGQLAPLPS
jgi:hypothetical protein